MSQINVNTIKNKSGNGAPNFPSGVTVTGVATATSFVGALDGDNISSGTIAAARVATLNQNTTGTAALAEGLTGTPSITVQDITGVGATFTGNVSIGGTLTYEDVTNIDSVGIVTARAGVFIPDNYRLGFSFCFKNSEIVFLISSLKIHSLIFLGRYFSTHRYSDII